MGRLYERELELISQTIGEGVGADTSIIEKFLTVDAPILVVGSGGSFSAAKAIEYQCNYMGIVAKAITPLQLEEHRNRIYSSKIILLTARGNNHDIINAFSYCEKLEAVAILVICISTKSKIRKLIKNNGHVFLWEKDMSFGKDGYLSVNSLMAMAVVMAKAIYQYSGNEYFKINEDTVADLMDVPADKYFGISTLEKETLLVLHGGATTQVAFDMESKFSESALGNIQLVDFRNFAHGRHFWMAERGKETGVVAFVGEEHRKIAEKTLKLMPEEIPCVVIYVERSGIEGILQLYREMFSLVYAAGERMGINPGKPKVPDYGRKLYHVNCPYQSVDIIKKLEKDLSLRAAYRKYRSFDPQSSLFYRYQMEAAVFWKGLLKHKWKVLVFDYDGTLHWKGKESDTEKELFELLNRLLEKGAQIAVATGRGKSVREEMQKKINPTYWSKIAIGYYNGAICGWLDDNSMPSKEGDVVPALQKVYEEVCSNSELAFMINELEAPKPRQWTIAWKNLRDSEYVSNSIRERVSLEPTLKLVVSSHSMDVIEKGTSKKNIVNLLKLRNENLQEEDCLFIGDSGTYGGNDFEMLFTNGLSVDLVSVEMDGCWNFAPLGKRQLEATVFYLQHIQVNLNGELEVMEN